MEASAAARDRQLSTVEACRWRLRSCCNAAGRTAGEGEGQRHCRLFFAAVAVEASPRLSLLSFVLPLEAYSWAIKERSKSDDESDRKREKARRAPDGRTWVCVCDVEEKVVAPLQIEKVVVEEAAPLLLLVQDLHERRAF